MGAQVSRHAALELPDDLFGLVIAKLPLLYIFQLRLVCRKWNAVFHDTQFLKRYSQLPGLAPVYLWPTKEGYAIYSLESNSWYTLPFQFFSMGNFFHMVFGEANGCWLVSGEKPPEAAVYLVNPITRSYRKLFQNIVGLMPIGMVLDENSKSYKIFAEKFRNPSRTQFPLSFCMYDTELQTWTDLGDWGGRRMRYNLPTFHRGVLHCLMAELDVYPQVWKVFRYEGGQVWHQLTTAQVPYDDPLFMHMFEWQGNLVLVGGLSSIEVWQLDEEKNVWMRRMRMPDDLRHLFSGSAPTYRRELQVQTSANHVFFIRSSFEFVRVVICNLSMSTWWEVPELANSNRWCRTDFYTSYSGFTLKPNFDTIYESIIV